MTNDLDPEAVILHGQIERWLTAMHSRIRLDPPEIRELTTMLLDIWGYLDNRLKVETL